MWVLILSYHLIFQVIKHRVLKNYSKKKLNNGIILKDIKKTYEKFLDEIKKYQFSYLIRNYSKLKNELPGRRHRKHTCKNIYLK